MIVLVWALAVGGQLIAYAGCEAGNPRRIEVHPQVPIDRTILPEARVISTR
jgi:hypothetical protein